LLYSETHGTLFATLAIIALLSFKEVERYLRYTGPFGLRTIVFNKSMKTTSLKHRLSFISAGGSSVASEASSDDDNSVRSRSSSKAPGELPPPVLVYHESARSIVFRDHVRRACDVEDARGLDPVGGTRDGVRHASFISERPSSFDAKLRNKPRSMSEHYVHEDRMLSSELSEMSNLFGAPESSRDSIRSIHSVEIQGFMPEIEPLPQLQLGQKDEFEPLFESPESQQEQYWTDAEKEVYQLLQGQQAVVKTIKNNEWTSFLHRFKSPHADNGNFPANKKDIAPHGEDYPFNSFVTSTSLLPSGGKKMRSYGAPATYTTGVVFALPQFESEDVADETAAITGTWSWPSGYSAKTEVSFHRNFDDCLLLWLHFAHGFCPFESPVQHKCQRRAHQWTSRSTGYTLEIATTQQ
jgi:hypothetical protein